MKLILILCSLVWIATATFAETTAPTGDFEGFLNAKFPDVPEAERKPVKDLMDLQKEAIADPDPKLVEGRYVRLRRGTKAWYQAAKNQPTSYRLNIVEAGYLTGEFLAGGKRGKGFQSLTDDVLSYLRLLAKEDPKNVAITQLKGQVLTTSQRETLQAVEAFRDCIKLDEKNGLCRERYDDLVAGYQSPYCATEKARPGVEFYLSSQKQEGEFTEKLEDGSLVFYRKKMPLLTGSDVETLRYVFDPQNDPAVVFQLTPAGKRTLAKGSAENVGKYLAIVIDGVAYSVPLLREPITEGKMILNASATDSPDKQLLMVKDWVNRMCTKLTSKTLPARLKL